MVTPLLEHGRLVRPLAEHVVTGHPISIIASATRAMRPSAAILRDWLLAESRDDRAE